jgi:hypothetical protein
MYDIKIELYRILTTDKLREGIFQEVGELFAESYADAQRQAEICFKSKFKKWVIITKD